ncbi:unnamed protein product (macronuclear) [Paramecium tetraurelia]|uniref:PAS domain-containing protein n=1 Tax=Paramecium tetraurelia TaxID=5888 RepID=A0BLJ3_PARTE|nr:uncharacterized protein GSPATT00030043001 [Paramecium tetraurelia]CAK59410.1 unnamed protein product [Paramecium tetraurelia]|eukprot:XP_001426808.1 hypothetical protein (macronuclear) [Paramecium tetraurelia strain d4-2]
MRITLIDNLTIIAHSQHQNQAGNTMVSVILIIPYIQYLSLLLPSHGWSYWNYSDGYLSFIQKACSYFTITPFFEFQNNFIYYPFTIFSLIIMVGLILYLSVFPLEMESENKKVKYQEGRTSTLCTVILFTIQTLQIPCYKFYIQQIIEAQQKNLQNQLIINIISIILYCLYIFMSEYFLRQYSFTPYHPMQQKFTRLRVSQILINLIAIVLTLEKESRLYNLIGLLMLHSIFILKMLNHLYYKPEAPHKNMIHFEASFTLESLAILITVNVFSENQIFPEEQIGIYIMFIFSLSTILGNLLFNFLLQLNFDPKTKQLYQIYKLYSYIGNITTNSITTYNLIIYQLINDKDFQKFQQKVIMNQKSTKMQDYYKLGLYIITEIFIDLKEGQKSELEELQLLFVSYLALIRNKPLIGYVEFKKFESNQNIKKSYYFQLMKSRIDKHLQKKITAIQQIYEKEQQYMKNVTQEKSVSPAELYEYSQIEEKFQGKVSDLIQLKISIWESQINGCKSIYEFEDNAVKLSKQIISCIFFLRSQTINVIQEEYIKNCDNILKLKICSMFHSFVLNDYYSAYLCEQKIQDIMKIETTQEQNVITRSNILKDETILIIISIVKQLGQVLNLNKSQIANYFGYSNSEFQQIANIKELMPQYFGNQHDQFLQTYIQEARTDLAFKETLTFAQGKNGFLIPQYLNVYNNFDINDDFTLIGSLTKEKEVHNYLIFDEYGKCIGITQQLSKLLVPQDNLEYFLENIDSFYVYMFLPHIHIYMNDILNNSNNNDGAIQQKSVLLYVFQDFIGLQKMHQAILNSYQQGSQKYVEQTRVFSQFEQMNSLITSPRNGNMKRLISEAKPSNPLEEVKNLEQSSLDFFKIGSQQKPTIMGTQQNANSIKENEIIDFLNAIEVLQKTIYFCTAKIQLNILGRKENKQHYFILELSEFVDKSNQQDEEKKQMRRQNLPIRRAAKRHTSQKQSYIQQFQTIPKSPDYHMDSSLMSPVGSVLQKKSFLDKSPVNNQILHYVSERRLNLMGSLGQADSQSFSEEVFSNEIQQVLQHQNEYKSNHGVGILKSQSSTKSGNSGLTAIEIVNKFKTKTSLISSLAIISLIKLVVLILFIIFMIINITQVNVFNESVAKFITDINLPINLNKYFLNLFTYSWITSLMLNDILNASQFINNQMYFQSQNMETTFINLTKMYTNFISLEENGYLDNLNITHLDNTVYVENVDFTDYIYYLEAIGYRLLHFESNSIYLSNLLKYRLNFGNIIQNNFQIIQSLGSYYSDQQDGKILLLFNQILAEIIIIGLIIFSQLYFWRRIEQYCQKILLLSNRLTESGAENQIIKFRLVAQIMKQTFGELGFKQQNCYKLCYTDMLQSKKGFKQHRSKIQSILIKSKKAKQQEIQTKKPGSSTIPLNSRISNVQINIIFKLIYVMINISFVCFFFLGDYLLYKDQSLKLNPAYGLAMDYIQFQIGFENTITVALMIKSEQQIYSVMSEVIQNEFLVLSNTNIQYNVTSVLTQVYSFNHSDLNSIYQKIIDYDIINGEDETYILTIYNNDFCLVFDDQEIPFCNKNLSPQQFRSEYGTYDSRDNNSQYLKSGIVGIVSKMDTFLMQYYEFEYQTGSLDPDFVKLNQQLNSQDFTNIIVQHYLDTYLGFEEFFNNIQESIINLITSQQNTQDLYQFLIGIFLLIFLIVAGGLMIIKVNLRLIHLRLLITLLPVEIMLDIYTISLLKILQ